MLISQLIFLVVSLRVLECASIVSATELLSKTTEQRKAAPSTVTVATKRRILKTIFSRYLNDELFQCILEYVAKSPGKMATVSKGLRRFVLRTKKLRLFYEGAGWDMPELACAWKRGSCDVAEMKKLQALRHVTDEIAFYRHIKAHLIENRYSEKENSFKALTSPLLKYLVRILYTHLARGSISDPFGSERCDIIDFAVEHNFYDVVFDMNMDRDLFLNFSERVFSRRRYFKFFVWVFDNPRARAHIMKRMIPRGIPKMSKSEIIVWTAACIHRKASESYYADYLKSDPYLLHDAIYEYLFKFSWITLKSSDKQYYHALIKSLIDRYVRQHIFFAFFSTFVNVLRLTLNRNDLVPFLEVLNDIRYGPDDPNVLENRRTIYFLDYFISPAEAIMAASKSNKKELAQKLAKHPKFDTRDLYPFVDRDDPQSFKAYFDIFEGPLMNEGSNEISSLIISDEFKFILATSISNGQVMFDIETSSRYVELGYCPTYEYLFKNDGRDLDIERFSDKMWNDAAEAGAEEFENFVTKYCGDHFITPNIIRDTHRNVSYKIIRLLLENERLVRMLNNHNVQVYCDDERISKESIATLGRCFASNL